MLYLVLKFSLSAAVVVAVSEFAKRSALLGGMVAALPVVSLLAMIFLYSETKDVAKVSELSTSIFWLVLPTLALFVLLPVLLRLQWNFYVALGASTACMLVLYAVVTFYLKRSGLA